MNSCGERYRNLKDEKGIAVGQVEEKNHVAALSGDDAVIATLEARREKTRAFKQGMTQELLTGRRRLV